MTNIYTKQQGLLSNVVMKIVPSDNLQGAWIVTGEGICFIDSVGNVKQVMGISVANSLDLVLRMRRTCWKRTFPIFI